MDWTQSNQRQTLPDHLRKLRVDRGQALQDLAGESGVSRATLSRSENGEVSPAAETLGRLAAVLALPISQLLAPVEQGFLPLVHHDEQNVWTDQENDYSRRTVSPPNMRLRLELIEYTISSNQRIAYERPAITSHEHHLVLLLGELWLSVGGIRYKLKSGDCLHYRFLGTSCFERGHEPARYFIAIT
jgi:transcriptional regulator with XRE-family HTH domain